MKFSHNWGAILLLTSLLLFWQWACSHFAISTFILPSPLIILKAMGKYSSMLLSHALVTGGEILAGVGFALLFAIPLAIAMFASKTLEKSLALFLVASQAIPVFALAPLLVVWLGYGMASKVVMATMIIFFPITISLLQGLQSCDPDYHKLFLLMGAPFRTRLRLLYWPWALPHFFAGLKVGVSVATIGAVIGEWVGAQAGLGFLMIQANARLQTDLVFAAITTLTIMGVLLFSAVRSLEKKILVSRQPPISTI